MFCRNCGKELNDNMKFCSGCGTPVQQSVPNTVQTQPVSQPLRIEMPAANVSDNKSSGGFITFCHIMIVLAKIGIFFFMFIAPLPLALRTYGSNVDRMLSNLISTCATPITVCAVVLFFFTLLTYFRYTANKHNERHYCRKCKGVTRHNHFGVCTNCYYDEGAMFGPNMIFSIVIIVSGIVCVQDGSVAAYIVMMVSYLFALLYKLYMYPARLARRTEQAAAAAIYWLNLLFGWTGLLWLVLLIWGSTGRGFGKSNTNIDINVTGMPVTATPTPTPNYAPAPPVPEKSMTDSFEELKRLHEMGMLTDDEFEEKRKEFVSRL